MEKGAKAASLLDRHHHALPVLPTSSRSCRHGHNRQAHHSLRYLGDSLFRDHQAGDGRRVPHNLAGAMMSISPPSVRSSRIQARLIVIFAQPASWPRPYRLSSGRVFPAPPAFSALRISAFGSRDCLFADLWPLGVSVAAVPHKAAWVSCTFAAGTDQVRPATRLIREFTAIASSKRALNSWRSSRPGSIQRRRETLRSRLPWRRGSSTSRASR